ncbi:MAG: hypothetical protein ACRYG8_51105 [Janthinobacterium lividum]
MKRQHIYLAVLAIGAGTTSSYAAGLHAVRPLNGYICKMLNITEQQALSPTPVVRLKTGPSPTAADAGWAPLTVAVAQSVSPENGYVQVMTLGGKTAWIAGDKVAEWHSKGDPSGTCTPAIMSNGRVGFSYGH